MAHIIRTGDVRIVRIAAVFILLAVFLPAVFALQPTCVVSNTTPTVHAEGLAEEVGNITFSCSGGAGTVSSLVVISLNVNITNRLDPSGNLANLTLTGAGVTIPADQPPLLNNPKTVAFPVVQFPGAGATFTISGIRAAIATITGAGATPAVTASVYASQVTLSLPGSSLFLAQGEPTLLSSVLNYGIPCSGSPASPLPSVIDFNALISAGTASSAVRVRSASLGVFVPQLLTPTSDFGVRFLVSLSGYGSNTQVYVPDVIVGNVAPVTSAGAFGTTAGGGTYSPNSNQLLLTRVNGADPTGAGGRLALLAAPAVQQSFPSVTQIPLVNGAATVTYEVLAAPGNVQVSGQIPVFVVVPPSTCPDSLQNTISVTLAPASTVATPTQTDPIPRYIPTTPASDCTVMGDCSASYFPVLQIATTSISLSGSSQGKTQSAVISVNNGGASQMNFNVSITYQTASNLSAANWLSASATSGVVETSTFIPITFTADPTALLIPGTYQATVTINAGSAGTVVLPVTFTVGPAAPPSPPPPTIQSVVNSASLQAGPVTTDSYATIFGSNLASKMTPASATVTFNGASATVIYDSSGQINVLVPASLGSATTASVVATIDGVASNGFNVNLVPNAPALFNPGIENQNYAVNSASQPASIANNEIIQIFLTGLATVGTPPVTVNISNVALVNTNKSTPITYAGAVPSVPGLEQVNVQLPSTLAPGTAQLSICVPGATGQQPICSASVPVYVH